MARTALPSCARCGAPLEVAAGATRTKCTFCGARLLVDDSERTREMPAARSFPAVDPKVARYVAAGTVVFGMATSLVALLARALPAPLAPPAAPQADSAPESQPLAVVDAGVAGPRLSAVGRGWLLADVDGDGADDAIGVFQCDDAERSRFLGAASAATGRELWRVDASLSGADPSAALRALVGNDLLVGEPNGFLRDLNPRTGKLLWSRSLPSPARTLCAGARDVVVVTADGASHRVSLATGADLPDAPLAPCEHAYTSQTEGPNFTVVRGAEAAKLAGTAAERLLVQRVLVPLVGAARVVVGTERSTGAAAIAVVVSGSFLWRALVVPDGAVDASAIDPLEATVRYDRVVVPYGVAGTDGPTLHVACFDLASGRRVWDEKPPTSSFATFADAVDVAISHDRRVFLRVGPGRLAILDLATGRARSPIGGP